MSSSLVVQLELKCLLKKPKHDDIMKQRKFTFNSLLKDFRGS